MSNSANKHLQSLEDANKMAISFYSHQPVLNGIACPLCGSELMDSNPMITLLSYPPQKSTKCSNKDCEYVGTRYC